MTEKWISTNYAFSSYELQYNDISRKLIIEEYIEQLDGNLFDYKFHCFHGTVRSIQVIGDRNLRAHTGRQAFYNINWELENYTTGDYPSYDYPIKKPKLFDEMLHIAEILSKGFIYVRVDLYNLDGVIMFGEMTFTPASGLYQGWSPQNTNKMWGDFIKLPLSLNKI